MLSKQPTHPTDHKRPTVKPENVDIPEQGQSDPAAVVQRAKAAPRVMTTGDVLLLQRTVGNEAVGQLLQRMPEASLAHGQPAKTDLPDSNLLTPATAMPTTGVTPAGTASMPTSAPRTDADLAGQAEIDNFAYEAYQYLYQNPTKTVKDFVDDMIKILGEKLLYPVTPKHMEFEVNPFGGAFFPETFEITVALEKSLKADIQISQVPSHKLLQLVDTLAHEARHAQQYLRIAQAQAGQGKQAKDIADDLSISPGAVQAAASPRNRLDPAKPEHKTRIAEAQEWEPFMGGKYTLYYSDLVRLGHKLSIVLDQLYKSPESSMIADIAIPVNEIRCHLNNLLSNQVAAPTDDVDVHVHVQSTNIEQAFYAFELEYTNQQNGTNKADKPRLQRLIFNLYNAYIDAHDAMAHEKDAAAAGKAASARFEQLFPPDSTTGLAARLEIDHFIYKVYERYSHDPGKSQKEFVEEIVKTLNENLVYRLQPTYTSSGAETSCIFCPGTFEISINLSQGGKDPIIAWGRDKTVSFVDALIREARHAEQFLRVAQMQAGQGKPAADIAKNLGIPPEAAQAAADPKNRLDAEETKEAQRWEPFIGGRYDQYKKDLIILGHNVKVLHDQLNDSPASSLIDDLAPTVNRIQADIEKLRSHQVPDPKSVLDLHVHDRIANIEQAFFAFDFEYTFQQDGMNKFDRGTLIRLCSHLGVVVSDAHEPLADEKDADAVALAAVDAAKAGLMRGQSQSPKQDR